MKKLFILGLAACSFAACKPKLEPEAPSAGSLDFSRYLAVGNSLTAGFADGTLYKSGQESSYPAQLAKQFAYVGGGQFKQPLLPGEVGYPGSKRILAMRQGLCDTAASLTPVIFPGANDSSGSSKNIADQGPFNNTGIPGIRSIDFMAPASIYATANPYARRMFSGEPGLVIDEVMRINPTFFTLWAGSNDVLSYASAGGEGGGGLPITPVPLFTAAYDSLLSKLTRNGIEGAVLNIPDITSTPYFTTIPANGLTLTKRQADDLNAAYNGTGVRFTEGAGNYFVIEDQTSPTHFRQIKSGEYLLLTIPQDSIKCRGWGTVRPIPATMVLDGNEVTAVTNAISNYNSIITTTANKYGVPVVDINTFLKTISTGFAYNGVHYTAAFVSGGAFSLDGLHLTPRGYSLVANHVIDRINAYYGAKVPLVDPNAYNGIKFP